MGMAGQGGAACPNDEPVMTKRILLIVSGGIAAYKSLELVRLLRRRGIAVRAVLTESAQKLVTPLSLGVLTEDHVYGDMFDLKEEREIGHIQLSRQADLVVVAPRSEEHTSELQSLMRISYAVFCLKKKKTQTINTG